jgi:LuxR family transcriptional regulator, maltose regulon positive regulatory protein
MTSPAGDFRFAVPSLPPLFVPRPRLLAALDEAEAAALTLVAAGPGAGKTVLLSDWARRRQGPVAWLALTREDDDPGRFWRLFLDAGRAAGQAYPPSSWASGHGVALLDAVFGRPELAQRRLTVVLDDGHVLTDPQILEGLDRLISRWSHRVRLVITARSDPLLPLHRYRLGGQVHELRAAELAMTAAEARELLDAHGVRLRDGDLRVLTARTEGWAAGLRLAALRMQGSREPAEFVAQLAMDRGSAGEYLTAEVLALQPEDVTRLLVETSFLDEVTGPLADAITGLTGCGSTLVELARTNSFVIPVAAARTTFRYHQLFREVLRHLANRQPVEQIRARYARAADWYRGQGDLQRALRWTIRSGDPARTRSLLVHGGLQEAFVGGQDVSGTDLRRRADEQPPAGAPPSDRVEFDVARWAVAALTAESATAAAEAERLPPTGPELDRAAPELKVTALLAQLILGQKAGDVVALDRAAERLLTDAALGDAVARTPGLRASVLLAQARARFTAGRLADVEPLLRRALAVAVREDVPAVHLQVLSVLAFVCVSAGRPRHAEDALDRAEVLIATHPGLERPVTLDLAIARSAELNADWTAMAAAVERTLAAGPVYADTGVAAAVAFVQATYLIAAGESGQARVLLRHTPALNGSTLGPLAVLRDCALAEIEILLGRPQAALGLLGPDQRSPFALLAAVTVARAHLALGDLRRAQASVSTVVTTPSPLVNRRTAVEALVCEAEIAERGGAEARAAELLDRALQVADGEFALPFVGAAETFAPLLARHPTIAERWPDRPSGPVDGLVPVPAQLDGADLPDPLTFREQAVLRLMTTSMSTAEIAEQLSVSVHTVKSHLAAIYRKLAVNRRREAVLRARELELL